MSHGLHALTLEDIRYFFDPNAGISCVFLWQNLNRYFLSYISGIFLTLRTIEQWGLTWNQAWANQGWYLF